jgi:hypothetical protein
MGEVMQDEGAVMSANQAILACALTTARLACVVERERALSRDDMLDGAVL